MSKQSIEEFLSAHAFFSKMDASFLKFLADSVTELQIKQGGVLFKHGNRADKFYLLRTGQVSIQVPAVMGPTLEIQTLGENQILRWSWRWKIRIYWSLTAALFWRVARMTRSSATICSSVSQR